MVEKLNSSNIRKKSFEYLKLHLYLQQIQISPVQYRSELVNNNIFCRLRPLMTKSYYEFSDRNSFGLCNYKCKILKLISLPFLVLYNSYVNNICGTNDHIVRKPIAESKKSEYPYVPLQLKFVNDFGVHKGKKSIYRL